MSVEKHLHNGMDSDRIHSSNIEYNNSGDKNIKSSRLESVLKDLDKAIDKKIDKIESGEKGTILIINSEGNIEASTTNISNVSKTTHDHDSKMNTIDGIDGNIPIIKNSHLKDSGIKPSDLITKEDSSVFIKNAKTFSENNIVIFDKNGSIKDSKIKISDISGENHEHQSYLKKISGENNNIVIIQKDSIIDSGINIDSLKKINEIDNKINKIDGNKGNLILIDKNGIADSGINIDEIFNHEHNHDEYLLKNELLEMIKNSNILKEIVKEEVKSILKGMLDGI